MIGLAHSVDPAAIDEQPRAGEEAAAFARRTALDKARAVASRRGPEALVLGADTVVELEGVILGKPETPADARNMLVHLSGSVHMVHTAMALVGLGRSAVLCDSTQVEFGSISQRLISWYVATGEPLDKAGAYAIQQAGGLFVKRIDGSPHTVVGLPIHRLGELYAELGLDLFEALDGA